jgi:hypothetical protein
MFRQLSLAFALATGLALTGCATTPPKPLTFDQLGQFNAYPLNTQSYRISFQANRNMSYGTAEEVTLLKAAQTTLQQGYRYFKVLDDPSNRSQQAPRQAVVYANSSYYPYYPYGFYNRSPYYWRDPFFDQPRVVNIEPTQVAYTIECYKDQKTKPDDAFDATLILQSLGQKYGLSPTGQVLSPMPTS